MDFFITPEDAQNKMIRSEVFTSENIPSLGKIQSYLEDLQLRIEDWLNYTPIPTEYKQQILTNQDGIATLPNYPVLSVQKVEYVWSKQVPSDPNKINLLSLWRGNRKVQTGLPSTLVEITYTAGHDPISPLFAQCQYQLLLKAIENNSPDLSWLEEPTRDITSLSLPGGLSHSWKLGTTDKRSDKLSREIDRVLAPLLRFRRTLLT